MQANLVMNAGNNTIQFSKCVLPHGDASKILQTQRIHTQDLDVKIYLTKDKSNEKYQVLRTEQTYKTKETNAQCYFSQALKSFNCNSGCSSIRQKIQRLKEKLKLSQITIEKIKSKQKLTKSKKQKKFSCEIERNLLKTPHIFAILSKQNQLLSSNKGSVSTQSNDNDLLLCKQPVGMPSNIKSLKFNKRAQNFLIIKYLDQGSYGKVYLVSHLQTGMLLCLKQIHKSNIPKQCTNQLIQQIKIQSFINHPNIINLYGYSSDAQNIYLLLEPCLGQNVFKKINKGAIPQKQVRKNIKQICSAVQFMHKSNIIHRDIKAENVLFHQDTIKICDFGWAVYTSLLRSSQCGTPLYASPELIKNQKYDSKIDIWSIGILTYQMLFGQTPFEIHCLQDLQKIVTNELVFSQQSSVTETAKQFLQKCLAKRPNERFSIRQCLQHEFIKQRITRFRQTCL